VTRRFVTFFLAVFVIVAAAGAFARPALVPPQAPYLAETVEEVVDRVNGVRHSAAVGIDSERTGAQRLHVVAEVRSEAAGAEDFHDLVCEITSRVHRTSGHRPARVILVRSSTIPKTSSGEIQHSRLVQMIQDESIAERVVFGRDN
jgi:acyl-coenzyme A synthetase/AMP-(fatty) acid ligase